MMTDERAPAGEECPKSERVDGKKHSWAFDGDSPIVVCHFCGERRDALTGRPLHDLPSRAPSASPAPLREALREYGSHKSDCGTWEARGPLLPGGIQPDDADCTCGLRAALTTAGTPGTPDRRLDARLLGMVIQDWMPDGADVSIGYAGRSAHLVGNDLARYLFERAAEYPALAESES